VDIFKYSEHQAGAFSATLISAATSKDPSNTMNAIIHRGIDGHHQWQQRQTDQLKVNIEGVFNAVGA
jgi:hypothetical protein